MNFEVVGQPLHTRCLSIAFVQGAGESVNFRADIFDLRKSGLMSLAGRVASAGIIHKMELHGHFSAATGILGKIEWEQSHVMHEANRATKGECCRDPMMKLKELVGLPLGEGFARSLKQCFGGPLGCTHINTLFQELSAFVARLRELDRDGLAGEGRANAPRATGERIALRSVFFDAVHSSESARNEVTQLSVRLSDFFFDALTAEGAEQLRLHEEVRLIADVTLAGWSIEAVRAAQRSRSGPDCDDSPWQSREAELQDFVDGASAVGMARFCLDRFGSDPADARLLSALLTLAPGMTQVGITLSDTLVPSSHARPDGQGLPGPGPCYMLRAEGPLMQSVMGGGSSGETKSDA